MEKIIITKDEAIKLHDQGNEITKQFVMERFGKEIFDNNYIQVWDRFLIEFNFNISLPYSRDTTDRQQQRTNASHMLDHIVPAERGYREPDYDNSKEYNYEPIFRISSGFGFSGSFLR